MGHLLGFFDRYVRGRREALRYDYGPTPSWPAGRFSRRITSTRHWA